LSRRFLCATWIVSAIAWIPGTLWADLPSACEGDVAQVVVRSDVAYSDPDILLRTARLEVGEPIRMEDLQRGLRGLRATGLGGSVAVYCRPGPAGVVVEYAMRGTIQVESVELVGDLGLKRRDLESFIPQRTRAPLVEDRVIRGVYRLQDKLREEGFLDALVRIQIDVDEDAKRAQLAYEVDAGRRYSIGAVDFLADLSPGETTALRKELKRGTGRPFVKSLIRREPERLERWLRDEGYLRAIVGEPTESPNADLATVDLSYPVDRGPRVDVIVEGAKTRSLRRRGLLPFLEGAGYDNALVAQSRTAIERHFQSRGFYDVAVRSDEEVSEDGIELMLSIDRGQKRTVESLEIQGNEAISTAEIRPRIATTSKRFLSRGSGRLVDEVLDGDLSNVRSFYALNGFPDAQVGPAEIESDGEVLHVEIPIEEGEQRQVVLTKFHGVEEFDEQELASDIYLERGGPYHPLLLEESVNAIRAAYQDRGYASVGIETSLDWGVRERLVDVSFQIEEGPRTVVEGIIVRGNQRTDREIVLRAMDIQEGDPVSARSLLEVQRHLYGLGIFSGVSVTTLPGTPYSSGRDLLVSIDEGKRRKVTYGVGWDSEDGARGLLGYTHNNLFGRGVSARFDIQASERDRQTRLLVRQPYIGLKEVPVRYSLFSVEEEQDSFDSVRRGAQIEASRRLGRTQWSLLYAFSIVDTELKPPLVEIDRELASVEIASLTPSVFIDHRNDPVNPTSGSTTNVQIEYAFPFFSADSHEFAKLFAQRTAYVPLGGFGTLAGSLRFGGIEPIGDDNLVDGTVSAEFPSRFVPISERFFAGGPSTHRAFRLDDLAIEGESATDRVSFGGNGLVLLNLDYRFPISGALEGTLFYDTGNIWGDWRDMDFDEFRHGAGAGIRYMSPIGPLRVEVGWKLDREPGESSREIFLSFGHPF